MSTSRVAAALGCLLLAACSTGSARPTAAPSTGTTAPAQSPTGAPAQSPAGPPASSWPTYHGDTARTGDAGADVAMLTGALRTAWTRTLDGPVYAEPILVGDTALVATENDTVYALRVTDGKPLWRRHLGTPVPLSQLPCGNIDPTGITGTPAYDDATGSVFVVTESSGSVHTLYALAATTGAIRWHRSLDVTSRPRVTEQQRAAVLVTRGRVVVAFGGRYGDCGRYVGYVTSVATSGQGATSVYTVPTPREAGIWAPAGPVVGPGGDVDVSTGNGAATGGSWDGSDSVVALDPLTLQRKASFVPDGWQQDNAQDLDLGSLAPVPVAGRVLIAGKRGTAYLLSASLGLLTSRPGCAAYGGAAVRGSTVFLPCTGGVRSVHVGPTSLSWGWQAAGIPGSPVLAGGAVYAVDAASGRFDELSIGSGRLLGSVALDAGVSRFATPTVADGGRLVLVPTLRGVVAIR